MASDCVCNTVALLLEKLQVPDDGPLGDEVGRFLAPVVTVLSYPDLLRYPALVAALGSILGRLVEEFDLGLERSEEIYAGVPALLVHPSPAIRAWVRRGGGPKRRGGGNNMVARGIGHLSCSRARRA